MKKLVLSLIACSTLFTLSAQPKIEGSPSELTQYLNGIPSEISIRVLSEKSVKSDEAVVHFVVSSTEDSLKEAIEENRKVLSRVTSELIDLGVAREKVSSKAFSSLPSYSFYSSKPTSFTTKKTVSVKVSSEDEFLKVLAVLEDFEDKTRFLKLSFNFNDKEGIEKELLLKNLKKVAEKKAIYEQALGIKLKVKKFTEGVTRNNFPQHVAATALKSYSKGLKSLGSSSFKTAKSDGLQWLAADQNQQGFSEYIIERELEVIYTVGD